MGSLCEHKLPEDSRHLCEKHTHEFEEWWDPDLFDWGDSWALAEYCYQHFDMWWNPDLFDWDYASWVLAKYCSEHFNIWWDPEKFDWDTGGYFLVKYCFKYIDVWIVDFLQCHDTIRELFIQLSIDNFKTIKDKLEKELLNGNE